VLLLIYKKTCILICILTRVSDLELTRIYIAVMTSRLYMLTHDSARDLDDVSETRLNVVQIAIKSRTEVLLA